MTFEEAKKELAELAGGKYHTIRFSVAAFGDIKYVKSCEAYVEGFGWVDRSTWRAALDDMRAAMTPEPDETPEHQAPKGEA